MQRWEYIVANFTKLEGAVTELDRLGAEGWEAVGLVPMWGPGRLGRRGLLVTSLPPAGRQHGERDRAPAERNARAG